MIASSDEVSSPLAHEKTYGSREAADSTLKDVNERLTAMGDSTINSKNSSLLPDKLFQDDTLDSQRQPCNHSTLVKDENGQYIIDSMSSF